VRETGRRGLPAEAVLRCAVLKQYRQLSYEELAFHLEDSASFRAFARLPMGWTPKTAGELGPQTARDQPQPPANARAGDPDDNQVWIERLIGWPGCPRRYQAKSFRGQVKIKSFSSAFASFRSGASEPSVNQS
jgi:hypothetical protein